MVFLCGVLIFSFCTALLRRTRSNRLIERWEGLWTLFQLLLYGLFLCEAGYFVAMWRQEALWFCLPPRVGWGWAIGNFVIFTYVLINHYFSMILMLRSRAKDANALKLNWKIGFLSIWYGAIAEAAIWRLFRHSEDERLMVLLAVIVCQFVQAARIRKHMRGRAAGTIAIYLVGVAGLMLSLALYLPVAIVVAIACIVIVGLISSHGMVKSDDSGASEPVKFIDPEGREHYITDAGNGMGRDEHGNDWLNHGNGTYTPL